MAGKLKNSDLADMATKIEDHNQAVIDEMRENIDANWRLSKTIKNVTDEQGELAQAVRQLGEQGRHMFNNTIRPNLPEGKQDPIE